jgi:hypothetical protein
MTHYIPGVGVLLAVAVLGFVVQADEPAALRLEATISLGDVKGRIDHLAMDMQRRRLFVAEIGNDSVAVVDLESGRLLRTLAGFAEPQGLAYVPATDELYVANGGDGTVRILDGGSFASHGLIALGDDADNVRTTVQPARVIVGHGNGALAVIDPVRRKRISEAKLKAHPEGFQIVAGTARAVVNVPAAQEIAVVEMDHATQTASWPLTDVRDNFPMAAGQDGRDIWVATRRPARLIGFDVSTGARRVTLECCEDADDIMIDAKRQRIYVSCGAAYLDTWELRAGRLARLSRQATVPGARTALFVPELDRLYLAVRAIGTAPAAIWVYRPVEFLKEGSDAQTGRH